MCRKLAGSPASTPGPWTSMEKAAGLISGARGMDPASLTVQTLCSQQLQSKLVHLGNHMGQGSSVLQPFLTISLSRGGQTPQTSPCTWLLSTAACAGSQAGAPSQRCSYFQRLDPHPDLGWDSAHHSIDKVPCRTQSIHFCLCPLSYPRLFVSHPTETFAPDGREHHPASTQGISLSHQNENKSRTCCWVLGGSWQNRAYSPHQSKPA